MHRYLYLFLMLSSFIYAQETSSWITANEKWKTTEHSITIDGEPLNYTANAGSLDIYDKEGKVVGKIFFTAYLKTGDEDRPITFAFNGGPGSSSVWLHMGALGPKRILNCEEGQMATPPYSWTTNNESILDVTDLVFIDPIGTGFSRTEATSDKQFYEVRKDIESIGEFIRDFITIFDRWDSPKYLAGESYGTTRAAGLSQYLHESLGIYLNGIVFISCAIDFQTLIFSQGNYLPNVLFVPTFTAAAWYHEKLQNNGSKSLEKTLEESKEFAYNELLPALYLGNLLSEKEQKQVINKLSFYTGIPVKTLQQYYPNFTDDLFIHELLKEDRLYLGRFDSRYTAPMNNLTRQKTSSDPSAFAVEGIFTGAFNAYLREELGLTEKYLPYEILNLSANSDWVYTQYSINTLNTMDALRWSMCINPDMQIFVGSGFYDLATPFAATDYTFLHLNLSDSYQDNIMMRYYEGGHMFYLTPSNHKQFKQDLLEFYSR